MEEGHGFSLSTLLSPFCRIVPVLQGVYFPFYTQRLRRRGVPRREGLLVLSNPAGQVGDRMLLPGTPPTPRHPDSGENGDDYRLKRYWHRSEVTSRDL